MDEGDCFPYRTKRELAKDILEYFDDGDFYNVLYEMGSRWVPTVDYIENNITCPHKTDIRDILRKNYKVFLQFYREWKDGTFVGEWIICDKKEYHNAIVKKGKDIDTRINSYNTEADDGTKKWPSLKLPHIQDVPKLPPYILIKHR